MIKTFLQLIILLFTLTTNTSLSQELEPMNVTVNWKNGTSKTITQIDSMIVYNNDTLTTASRSLSQYNIQILSLKDTVYTILFKQIAVDDEFSIESETTDTDPIRNIHNELMLEIQKRIAGLEYRFLVDKNTATAFEVLNKKGLQQFAQEIAEEVFDQKMQHKKIAISPSEKTEIKQRIKENLQEILPAVIETMLNSFNYTFQAYGIPFVLDETYSTVVEVSLVDQIEYSGLENNAELVVNSSFENDEVTIDFKYIYEKETAFQNLILQHGNENGVTIDEFDVDERVISKFDTTTSWMKSCNSFTKTRFGALTVRKMTYVTIK